MKRFWTWLHGVGSFAGFSMPKPHRYYPYAFPEEALTRDWEMVGHAMKDAVKKHQEENHDGR